ncbi:MAG: ABC transporter permease [Ruminococcus sp.]|nr:ABC transporter permease [Ruminococcus sp.]
MIIGIKDSIKLLGISVISCCAVLVCTMFLNYYIDITNIKDLIHSEQVMIFYNAQVSTAKVVCAVSGGCLLITSIIMLMFYIKHYIDSHKKELGILKALGYSELKIAGHFAIFGSSVFLGTAVGFGGAFFIMPLFYDTQNKDKLLPDIEIKFHPELFVYLVLLPTVVFALLAVLYACVKLRIPANSLLRENFHTNAKIHKYKDNLKNDQPFLTDIKKSTLKSRKSLVFFITFASFCFSSMTQMSFSMKDLSSFMMGAMIMVIGLTLSVVTLLIAVTTVINGNKKSIAMMRVFGYSQKECFDSLLGGYRPAAYIGFAVGSIYQYALLKIMVEVVFKDMKNVPEYKFDFPMMFLSLAAFIILYELIMLFYAKAINKFSIKEIMLE